MKQKKLLICLLSTTLVIPSLSPHSTYAENNNDAKKISEQEAKDSDTSESSKQITNKSDSDSKSSKDENNASNDEFINTKKDTQTNNTSKNNESEKHDTNKTTKDIEKNSKNESSSKEDNDNINIDSSSNNKLWDFLNKPSLDNHTHVSTFLDSIFDNSVDSSSLSSSFSKESTKKQPIENDTTDQSQNKQQSTHDNTDHALNTDSESKPVQDDTSQIDHNDDVNDDAIDNLESNDTQDTHKTDSPAEESNNYSSEHDNNHQQNDSDLTSEKKDENSKSSADALDSILDQYSEDAKKTKKDYEASTTQKNSGNHQDTSTSTLNHSQLPTDKELANKQEPSQSFENDTSQNNTRSTTLFQTLPDFSDDTSQTSDFTVVENKDTRDFIKSIAKDAHQIGQHEDIYASVMIAQAILESDSGNSALAKEPNFNLFGMKGSYKGQSSTFNTLEANGNDDMYQISAQFRSYPSTRESLEDYADLIKNGIDGNAEIYKPTWKHEAPMYQSATSHLATTYATDPQYADKLNSLIKHYDLTQFDKKDMPNLDDYTSHDFSQDTSGDGYKPFSETTTHSPYPHGQCTWYVYNRMAQFDKYIAGDLGDARNWNNRAETQGFKVSSKPITHSAVVFEAGQQGVDQKYGHVAFVEKVNNDGSIVVSESNVKGLGIISFRTIDADDAKTLSYIQGKDK